MASICNMFDLMFYFLVLVCSLNNAGVYACSPTRKCYGELGCFDAYDFPYDKLPSSRDAVGTQFTLKTGDMTAAKSLSANDVSSFDSANPTKFIIHGFSESGSEDWVIEMRRLLLIEGNYNVIIVDWEKGAEDIIFEVDYDNAVGNSRIVGAEIALLITKLQSVYSISLNSVHLIGFSLGAHVAGYAGKRLGGGEIGNITGLDAAKPGFEDEEPYRRLDPTDALYVDVIHTDTDLWGISDSIGHVDYYPSGGEDQPGCAWYGGPACDHRKAVEYFMASIEDQQQFSCEYYRGKYDDTCIEK